MSVSDCYTHSLSLHPLTLLVGGLISLIVNVYNMLSHTYLCMYMYGGVLVALKLFGVFLDFILWACGCMWCQGRNCARHCMVNVQHERTELDPSSDNSSVLGLCYSYCFWKRVKSDTWLEFEPREYGWKKNWEHTVSDRTSIHFFSGYNGRQKFY